MLEINTLKKAIIEYIEGSDFFEDYPDGELIIYTKDLIKFIEDY